MEMKKALQAVLTEVPEGLSKKKLLRQAAARALTDGAQTEDVSTELCEEAFQGLLKKGKITHDSISNVVTLLGLTTKPDNQGKTAAKRERSASDAESKVKPGDKKKAKKEGSQDQDKSNWPKDLWKTGEQLWREDGFDGEYLRTNPENITRLFCGNLSKTITEDQLKSFIDGITYINWITDQETKQFYGSTFIEVRDPKAAVEAVLKDKQKFMGR
jgi:hypothetical protein